MTASLVSTVLALLLMHTSAHKTLPMSSKQAAEALNEWFADDGVFTHQVGFKKPFETFCGGGCYDGYSDCRVSTTIYNMATGLDAESKFSKYAAMYADYGVLFNTTVATTQLATCYWASDGGTNFRWNGGCGCLLPKVDQNCQSPHSPYTNIGPDGKKVYGNSPLADKCRCTTWDQGLKDQCFWRGPAYNTGHGLFGSSELPMLWRQLERPHDPIHMPWDEAALDVRILDAILATDPASAIVAVFLGNDKHGLQLQWALKIQSAFKERYGVELPMVKINRSQTVSKDQGPFFEFSGAAEETVVV